MYHYRHQVKNRYWGKYTTIDIKSIIDIRGNILLMTRNKA